MCAESHSQSPLSQLERGEALGTWPSVTLVKSNGNMLRNWLDNKQDGGTLTQNFSSLVYVSQKLPCSFKRWKIISVLLFWRSIFSQAGPEISNQEVLSWWWIEWNHTQNASYLLWCHTKSISSKQIPLFFDKFSSPFCCILRKA